MSRAHPSPGRPHRHGRTSTSPVALHVTLPGLVLLTTANTRLPVSAAVRGDMTRTSQSLHSLRGVEVVTWCQLVLLLSHGLTLTFQCKHTHTSRDHYRVPMYTCTLRDTGSTAVGARETGVDCHRLSSADVVSVDTWVGLHVGLQNKSESVSDFVKFEPNSPLPG